MVGSLTLRVLIILEILLFCIPVTLLWLEQLFRNLPKHKVAMLSYSVRGPFQIIRNTCFSSYFVRKLNKSDSPELTFIAYDV